MKGRLTTPSPALVISVIALFVALGGTAYATTSLPNNSVGTRQIKNGAVTKQKISTSTLKQLKGNRGPAGKPGTNGTAIAFAHILANGTIDTTRSKNVSTASNPDPGIYCLKTTVSVANATASVDGESNTFGAASVLLSGQDPSNYIGQLCPAGDDALIWVEDLSGANEDVPTYATFN
jgi:hypothetical protein